MNRRTGAALLLLMAALFLIANRAAYKGYFQDDELDNLSWAPLVPAADYVTALISPRFLPNNFRPAGHAYFALAGPRFGLDFPRYLIPIHLLHFLNVWLVWVAARRLGAARFSAGAAALFFAFHMAVFDVYWKPMYVFDLLCGTFCLLSLLCWIGRRWVLSFLAFWLAYKSKELAVMLPAVLALYEYWFGKRRWLPLAPFFLASLSFGLQGLLLNPNADNAYSFRFSPSALATTVAYYSGRIFLIPFAGLVLFAVPFLVRDRRVWLGIAGMLLFFVPLAFLPGRLFGAYCYVPLAVLSLAVAGAADRQPRAAVAGFFLLWIPWNYLNLRASRRQALALANDNRTYVTSLAALARTSPGLRTFVYDGRPEALNAWGIQGVLRLLWHDYNIRLAGIEDKDAAEALARPAVALLTWDPSGRKLVITSRQDGAPEASFVNMDRLTPVWQLGSGWYPLENGYRWTEPVAVARLRRPPDARRFALTLNVSPEMIRDLGSVEVEVLLEGRRMEKKALTKAGWETVSWKTPVGLPETVRIEFRAPRYRPSNQDPRTLGVAVVSFGFVAGETT